MVEGMTTLKVEIFACTYFRGTNFRETNFRDFWKFSRKSRIYVLNKEVDYFRAFGSCSAIKEWCEYVVTKTIVWNYKPWQDNAVKLVTSNELLDSITSNKFVAHVQASPTTLYTIL